MSDFDREIERELDRVLGPVASSSIPAFTSKASGGLMKKFLGGAGVAIGAKVLTGFAVAALAAVSATAATEAAITGSLNPNDWGQQVVAQVAKCKAALQPGQHGIGDCVSAFAQQHGPSVSADHRASPARTNPGKGHGKNDNPGQDGNGGTGNKPTETPHGKPSAIPSH
jgi:hypothetical protein